MDIVSIHIQSHPIQLLPWLMHESLCRTSHLLSNASVALFAEKGRRRTVGDVVPVSDCYYSYMLRSLLIPATPSESTDHRVSNNHCCSKDSLWSHATSFFPLALTSSQRDHGCRRSFRVSLNGLESIAMKGQIAYRSPNKRIRFTLVMRQAEVALTST
jgi:hypothetical protein